MTNPTDHALMLAAQRGDLEALDALFVRHHRPLYGFLVRLTGDREAAEDLVQEVFLRLLRFRESFAADGAFRSWLYRIARNLAADRFAKHRPTLSLDGEDPRFGTDPFALDHLIAEENREQLERVLASLPYAEREMLLLRSVEGLSHREIGHVLGCTEAAARVRFHRAIAALKRKWFALAGEPT